MTSNPSLVTEPGARYAAKLPSDDIQDLLISEFRNSFEGDGAEMAKCPHCEKEVTLDSTKKEEGTLEVRKDVEGLVKKEVMYSCPHCDRVLGFAFFFGGIATGRP